MDEKIKQFIDTCKRTYYSGNPIISNEQYDTLTSIYDEDYVGYPDEGDILHMFGMHSLQKFYEGDDIPLIFKGRKTVKTLKYDGAAISLKYSNCKLQWAATRGDGIRGKDVTNKVPFIKDLPTRIPYTKDCQIDGEIVVNKSIPNARNICSGLLGRKDLTTLTDYDIYFRAYSIRERLTESYTEDLNILKSFGFVPVSSEDDEFPSDGYVIRLDDNNAYYDLFGFTSKHPRGAYALKTRSEGIPTKLIDVVWQTGKSGKITPVAILDPIEIDGALVSRATLNNPGFISALDLEIGDTVLVERAGGIIPRIISKST